MSYFAKELWNALTRPFKVEADGECRKWVLVLGSLLDDARESVLNIRRQWTIEHARGWVLDMRGAERDLPRWYNESDDDYRRRVRAAFALYAAGGTLPGMQRALLQIGYDDVLITERSGPTWAHFLLSFGFPLDMVMSRRERDMLKSTVWRIKPAHTMPLYLMRFSTGDRLITPVYTVQFLLTNHTVHYFYGNRRRYYPLDGCVLLDGSITLGDWMTLQTLDGVLLLDGTSLLDGYTQYGHNEPHNVRFFLNQRSQSLLLPTPKPWQTIQQSSVSRLAVVHSDVKYHVIRNYRYAVSSGMQNPAKHIVTIQSSSRLINKPVNFALDGSGRLDGHTRLDGQELHDSILFKVITNNQERCEIL